MSKACFHEKVTERFDADQRREWFRARCKQADAMGARWHRYTYEEKTGKLLYEGWKARPEGEQGVSGPAGGA